MFAAFSHYSPKALVTDFGDFLIFTATDCITGVEYTVKSTSVASLRQGSTYKSFKFSLSIFRELRHDNIAEVVDVVEEGDFIFIVLEKCATDLLSFLLQGDMKHSLLVHMFQQIVDAVDYCHSRGLACSNLRPDNILLTDDLTIKIANLGETGRARAAVMFKAPELLDGRCSYEWWETDMWTLGVLLYAMTTGELPWKSGPRSDVEAQIKSGKFEFPVTIHPEVAAIIVRLTDLDPQQRWTIDDVKQSKWLRARRNSLDELAGVLREIYENPKKTIRPKVLGTHGLRLARIR